MDNFGISDRLCEMDESELSNMLLMESCNTDITEMMDQQEGGDGGQEDDVLGGHIDDDFDATKLDLSNYEMNPDWLDFFDDPVLNDKMMTEAMTNPAVKSEHSYSIGKTIPSGSTMMTVKNEPITQHHITLDDHTGPSINPKFLELDTSENRRNCITLNQTSRPRSIQTVTVTKQEPRVIVKNEPIIIEARRPTQQSLLKPSSILLTKQINSTRSDVTSYYQTTQQMSDDLDEGIYLNVMPMTPPGSSSDSDGGLSPRQSPTPSPIRQVVFKSNHREINPATAIYSQPIPTSGVLVLTEEEKRTLISEGYPIPSKLPLSKMEEKNLKKVRRKIKNKISAQESRRKRKEYMDHLEKKMEDISQENADLRNKCDSFERSNQSLMSQLSRLQNMLKKITPQHGVGQTSICLMVMILCFAVFFGDWIPTSFSSGFGASETSLPSHDSMTVNTFDFYSDPHVKPSRTLLAMSEDVQSCGNEPWPLFLARKSFEGLSGLITPRNVDESASWSNTSDMPIIVTASYDSSLGA